jgi:hypothetical protein
VNLNVYIYLFEGDLAQPWTASGNIRLTKRVLCASWMTGDATP